MDYTYRERQGEAIYRFKDAMLPSVEDVVDAVMAFEGAA